MRIRHLVNAGKTKPIQSQFKANFRKAKMNVTTFLTKEYENMSNWAICENKPNTKPNKANLLNAQMNVNKVLTRDYENKSNWAICENKPNTKPIQTQTKPISPPRK
jgi:hypoxanthine phosphoribosyltransferase